jgi:hypothetical protein
MKRSAWMFIVMAAAASSALGSDGQDRQTITVTGCLQNFSTKGTVGTTERGYLLTNVGRDGEGTPPAPGASRGSTDAGTAASARGTAGSAASGASGGGQGASKANLSYLIEGEDKQLKDQVGHKVEVTGTLLPREDETAKTDEAHMRVDSIRMLASNCSQKPK